MSYGGSLVEKTMRQSKTKRTRHISFFGLHGEFSSHVCERKQE